MGFAVALDLRHFVERAPIGSAPRHSRDRSGLPVKDSMIGNMRPLLRLPLCAMASKSLPVFCFRKRPSISIGHGDCRCPSGFCVV